jgi:mannan endo-1,4-beta-mannosidase
MVNPNATAETVQLWNFLKSIYGQKVISAYQWADGNNWTDISNCGGKQPAMMCHEINSWQNVRDNSLAFLIRGEWIQQIKDFYNNYGGIEQLQYHQDNHVLYYDQVGNYQNPEGLSTNIHKLTEAEWKQVVTPGTPENLSFLHDWDFMCTNYIKQLVDAQGKPIPIILRHMHEIDGDYGWFTGYEQDPGESHNYSAKLYAMIVDRVMNYNQCNNVIFAWCTSMEATSPEMQEPFYPGHQNCDIVGTDIYYLRFQTDGKKPDYTTNDGKIMQSHFNWLQTLSGGKMVALMECAGLPNPDKIQNNDPAFPRWLYAMAWYGPADINGLFTNDEKNTCQWVTSSFGHNIYLTVDELDAAGYLKSASAGISQPERIAGPLGNMDVHIFPNPAEDILNVKVNASAAGELHVVISDVSGRPVKVTKYTVVSGSNDNLSPIMLHGVSTGMYYVTVSANGNTATSKLLVK